MGALGPPSFYSARLASRLEEYSRFIGLDLETKMRTVAKKN